MHQIHVFISSAYFCVFRLRESNLPATDLSQAIYFAFFSTMLMLTHILKYLYLSLCPSFPTLSPWTSKTTHGFTRKFLLVLNLVLSAFHLTSYQSALTAKLQEMS